MIQISDQDVRIFINGNLFGKAWISNIRNSGESSELEGILCGECVLGDKSVPVTKARFCIPNLRTIYGEPVKQIDKDGPSLARARLYLKNSYQILLEKNRKFDKQFKKLKDKGGFQILYQGELEDQQGRPILLGKIQELRQCLGFFLSFINGQRTYPLFFQGLHDDEVVWTDYTPFVVSTYSNVFSWAPSLSSKGFSELWEKFCEFWESDTGKDFLLTALHWYFEANAVKGYTETRVVIAQIALELLYNYLIVEQDRAILGVDSEKISAANKIRLLLNRVKIKPEIPAKFNALNEYVRALEKKEKDDIIDGIVSIRNAIVHSQESKRKNLQSTSSDVMYQALELSTWYIEVALLTILDYSGLFNNRILGGHWQGQNDVRLPIIEATKSKSPTP